MLETAALVFGLAVLLFAVLTYLVEEIQYRRSQKREQLKFWQALVDQIVTNGARYELDVSHATITSSVQAEMLDA